jgi:3-isopropylmalate dehydrogenase
MPKIAIIGGDGIGPEVTREATSLLRALAEKDGLDLDLWELDLGADRYLRDGTTFPKEVQAQIQSECAAVLLGALGDPRVPGLEHARDILFGMRFGYDLFANVRPVKALADSLVPLKGRGARDVDMVVFRENTEGVYVGFGGQFKKGTPDEIGINEDVNTRKGVERIIRAAFDYAKDHGRKRVAMADKSNAMKFAHELWLRTFAEVGKEYPEIETRQVYVDALCLYMIQDPSQFEVVVTNNLFGDIITDLGAALQGGLGMAASANLHGTGKGRVALFEPVHGSAPPLAGKDKANPFAAFLTVGMMLSHLGWKTYEPKIEAAVRDGVESGNATVDVGGKLGTKAAAAWAKERVLAG